MFAVATLAKRFWWITGERLLRRILPLALILSIVGGAISFVRADPPPRVLTVATWNLEWFFDEYTGDNFTDLARQQSAPNRQEWEWKRDGVAAAIARLKPTILALQEVENQRVLYYLTRRLRDEHKLTYRIAFIQGTDYYTEQDVAILYQSGLVEYCRREQTSEMWDSKKYYNLQKHLWGKFRWGSGGDGQSLTMVNVHLRAMTKGASIRQRQAQLLRYWIRDNVQRGENVVVVGDFNTDESFAQTSPTSEIGIVRSLDTAPRDDDLTDLHQFLDPHDRQTHLLPGKQFDRILVSRSLVDDAPGKVDLVFKSIARRRDVAVRGDRADTDHWNKYYKIPAAERDLSDHYPLVATFEFH